MTALAGKAGSRLRLARLARVALTALVLTGLASAPLQAKKPQGVTGKFDYYAVALSWSPAYCADHADPDQCSIGRQLGFVLHGLWPQYEAGYPQNCSSERLPPQIRFQYESLYPSAKLAAHEWNKHGTCSGLDPAAYFTLSARLKNQLAIPLAYQRPLAPLRTSRAELIGSFKAANPGLAPDALLPYCGGSGRFLREIHVCYDKSGRSRSCSASAVKRSHNSCRQASFLVQNVR